MSTTIKVTWHPDAVRRAVEHGLAVLRAGDVDQPVIRNEGGVLAFQDLACLVDAGRAFVVQDGDPS